MPRWLGPTALVLALGTGCGAQHPADGAHPGSPTKAALTSMDEAAVRKALLPPELIGSGFQGTYTPSNPGLNVDERGPGCLKPLDAITWVSVPVREQQVVISAGHDDYPVIRSAVATFSSDREAEVAIPAYRKDLADCTRVNDTDGGLRWVLTVTTDDERRAGTVDDELNIAATGRVGGRSGSFHLSMTSNVARVGSNVVLTTLITPGTGIDADAVDLARAAVDRLRAVLGGRPVPTTSLGFERYDPSAPAGQPV